MLKHNGGGIQCNICGKKFKDNNGLKRHMPIHEEKSETCLEYKKNADWNKTTHSWSRLKVDRIGGLWSQKCIYYKNTSYTYDCCRL